MSAYDVVKSLIETLPVVDAHEHLPAESSRLATKPDFFTLFSSYCGDDLVSSGMSPRVRETLNGDLDAGRKWELFRGFYDEVLDGSYARAAHLSMKRFYGVGKLRNADDAAIVTARIRDANRAGLYDLVLKEACRVLVCLDDIDASESAGDISGSDVLIRIARGDRYVELISPSSLEVVEIEADKPLPTLEEYLRALGEILEKKKNGGCKGLKFALAYMRSLHFNESTSEEASRIFNRIALERHRKRNQGIGYEESAPLLDYLVGRVIGIAQELGLPVVFHTGYQAGLCRRLADADPKLLWNLLVRYRRAKFVLLHGGFPWLEEAALMAKQFPNLYLDMSWLHANSPQASIRIMKEYVDLLPKNKVVGFGGDTTVVENVYGYLQIAKENMAAAFSDLVECGILTEERCSDWLTAMLTSNPARIYDLDEIEDKSETDEA